MIDSNSKATLAEQIDRRVQEDQYLLDELRREIRALRGSVTRIQPRSATSMSLVATDGGNNKLQFDPFLFQLIRVVDSSNNEYCLETISPTTNTVDLSREHVTEVGEAKSALGEMMVDLGVSSIMELSPVIKDTSGNRPISPTWVQVYRELTEWAILYSIIKTRTFATDTLLVFDGLLRSKVFSGELFRALMELFETHIERHNREHRRSVYLVGVAKHSQVIDRYRLAMNLEGVLTTTYSAYVEVPRDIEEKAYVWSEYARGADQEEEGAEVNKFVGGKMFLVKFGPRKRDPIWPVDVFLPQRARASEVLSYLLADSLDGFPVPFYPRCLQKAHENAQLVDFDFDIFQNEIFKALNAALGEHGSALEIFRLQDSDPSQQRY